MWLLPLEIIESPSPRAHSAQTYGFSTDPAQQMIIKLRNKPALLSKDGTLLISYPSKSLYFYAWIFAVSQAALQLTPAAILYEIAFTVGEDICSSATWIEWRIFFPLLKPSSGLDLLFFWPNPLFYYWDNVIAM